MQWAARCLYIHLRFLTRPDLRDEFAPFTVISDDRSSPRPNCSREESNTMEDKIKYHQERIILLRKRLADIETRRARYGDDVPPEIWQELVKVSSDLDHSEQQMSEICLELANNVNRTRDEIVSTLDQYNRWREQMRDIELLFLANIVRPGHYLKRAIHQREHLESEYKRIYTSIQQGLFFTQQELETEIRYVLTKSDNAVEILEEDQDEEWLDKEKPADSLTEISVEDLVEAISMEELIKEFKRVVLPKVHPDTSNTPPEIFKTVFEVFKACDPILMEAYIIEYHGEIQPKVDADPLDELDQLLNTQKRHQLLSVRLRRRVDRIKQELTPQEIDNPEKVQDKMKQQRQEILDRIQAEAEQILYWRDKIENLLTVYREYYGHSEGRK